MMRKSLIALVVIVLLGGVVGAALALEALGPSGNTPLAIVQTRKAMMLANYANLGDINAKIGSGSLKAVAANARSMAAYGAVLPMLFDDAYSAVYPVEGSKYFYKAGTAADFKAAAQNLVSVVEALIALSDKEDKAGLTAQAAKISPACGACHSTFRGQY